MNSTNVPRETRRDRLENLLIDIARDAWEAAEAREQLAAILDNLLTRVERLETALELTPEMNQETSSHG